MGRLHGLVHHAYQLGRQLLDVHLVTRMTIGAHTTLRGAWLFGARFAWVALVALIGQSRDVQACHQQGNGHPRRPGDDEPPTAKGGMFTRPGFSRHFCYGLLTDYGFHPNGRGPGRAHLTTPEATQGVGAGP